MTSVYTRNKGTNKSVKRSFSLVISNLLISTVLMGALGISGGTVEAASSTQTPTQVVQVTQKYQDDATLLANVNLALDVLKKNGLTLATLSLLHSSLKDIENKVNANQFTSTNNLYKTLVLAESTLSGLSYNITLDVRNEFVESLTVVKRLTPISVYIDGIPQFYKQQPIEQNGIVFVPLRDIYEKLGAKVTSDTKTNTVIITKGNTVIKLPRGKDFAYVNGKSVKLSAKMCKLSFYFSTKRPFFCTFFQKALSPFLKECAKFFVNCFGRRFPFVSRRGGRKCDPVSRLWH
ncbi:hypothetical protein GS458_2811 [Geobacillus stearothermophilus]|nr:hypothetical protein GS458_2811 [Geobacillus stearothermophilus]